MHPFAALADMPNAGVPRLLVNREQVGRFRFGSDADGATDVFLGGETECAVDGGLGVACARRGRH